MLDVDGIESDDGGIEPYIGFGDMRSEVVRGGVSGEVGFGAVEGGEEGLDSFFVGFLGSLGDVSRWVFGRPGREITWRIRLCRLHY